jgi:hypothetical protein
MSPFRSKSQMRLFAAKQERGELKPGTFREWLGATKSPRKLPERITPRKSGRS